MILPCGIALPARGHDEPKFGRSRNELDGDFANGACGGVCYCYFDYFDFDFIVG